MSDSIIRDLTGYPTSRDYRKLWELAQRQSVVCVLQRREWHGEEFALVELDGETMTDVARTIWDGRSLRIGCPGVCYVETSARDTPSDHYEEFERQCRLYDLEWIVPADLPELDDV